MSNEDDFVASVNRLENLIDSNQQELKRTVDRTFGSLKDELNRLKSSRSALDQIHNVIALWDDRLFELSDLPIRIRNILEGGTVNNNNHEQAHDLAESEVVANVTVEPPNNLDGNVHRTEEHVNGLEPNVPSTVNHCNINESNSSVLSTKNVPTSTSVIPTNNPKAKDVSNQQSVQTVSVCISGGSTCGLKSRSLWPVCNCPSPHPHVDMHQEVKEEVKEEEEEKVDKGDEPANNRQNESPTTKQSKTRKRRAANKSLATENCSLENGLTRGEVTTPGPMTKRTRVSSLDRRVNTEQLSTGSRGDSLSDGDDSNGNVSSGEEEVKVKQTTIQSKRKSVPSNDQSNKKMKPVGQIRDANAEDGNKVKTIYLNCTELECKERLKSTDDLRQHLTTKHGLLPYKCYARGCNDRCETPRGISIHIREHHTDSTQFVCPICDQQYPLQRHVNTHLLRMHFTGKFQCNIVDECKQVGDTLEEIHLHFRRCNDHRASNRLQCDQCSLKFANQTNLNAHYIRHTRFNPFRCTWPDCLHQTNVRPSIIHHIRAVHFLLPVTKRERIAMNIVDDRDPADYFEEVTEQED